MVCTFPWTRSKFIKTHAQHNMICWSIHMVFFCFSYVQDSMFFDTIKAAKTIIKKLEGPFFELSLPKMPKGPIPIQKVGPKGPSRILEWSRQNRSKPATLHVLHFRCLCPQRKNPWSCVRTDASPQSDHCHLFFFHVPEEYKESVLLTRCQLRLSTRTSSCCVERIGNCGRNNSCHILARIAVRQLLHVSVAQGEWCVWRSSLFSHSLLVATRRTSTTDAAPVRPHGRRQLATHRLLMMATRSECDLGRDRVATESATPT